MLPLNKEKYGPWALITGAAQGLGAEFAKQIAAQGLNVVLVDIKNDELNACAQRIRSDFDIEVLSVCVDLSRETFMDELLPPIRELSIGLLVNNAGIPKIGRFLPQSTNFLVAQVHVNNRAVLLLSHHFANQMAANGGGGIIILSSGAGELASAYNANYCATKAYDLKLAEALWEELKPHGIDVLGFMPGSTKTEGFMEQAGDKFRDDMTMSTQDTVEEALHFLGRRPSVAAGRKNRIINFVLMKFLPRHKLIQIVSQQIRKMFPIA